MKRINRFGVIERDPMLILIDLIHRQQVCHMVEKIFDERLKNSQPADFQQTAADPMLQRIQFFHSPGRRPVPGIQQGY